MSAALAPLDPVPPEVAAQWLFDRCVPPEAVATDTALAERLFETLVACGIRRHRAPQDFPAVRLALRQLHEETP